MRTVGVAVALLAMLGAGCKPAKTGSKTVTIYVPCGMEMPFMDLEKRFEEAHQGVDIRLLLDNSHILTERIADKGERPDAVVSPGGHELAKLIDAGLVKASEIRRFGQYDLCLFVPRANTAGIKRIEDLTSDAVKVIAVADPDKTSIGHFTVETLKNAGIWDVIQPKVLPPFSSLPPSPPFSPSLSYSSFAYRSCPLKTAPDKLEYCKVRIIQSVPNDLYGPAYASAVVLKTAPNPGLAEAFIDMLLSENGQAILRAYELPSLKDDAAK